MYRYCYYTWFLIKYAVMGSIADTLPLQRISCYDLVFCYYRTKLLLSYTAYKLALGGDRDS